MRSNCQILIYIDLKKALEGTTVWIHGMTIIIIIIMFMILDGISFFRSANGVILSPGNEEGFLLPKYFEKTIEL